MQIKSYEDAIKYLEEFIGKVVFKVDPESIKLHPPLDRMKMLLSLLDNPQDKFKSVLVGGTSGKGSTAYLISHILTTAGYKTGLTISPHLQKINERLQINGKLISDKEFTKMVRSIVDTIELMNKTKVGAPSYFEILIAMSFLYFAKEHVDIAVVEVGMGGEFDATNTLYPLIAVLTNVSLDHTNVLGGTVQKIARTKMGIIKRFSSCHLYEPEGSQSHRPEFISGSPASRQVCLRPNEMLNQASPDQHDKERKPIVVTGVKQPSVIKIVEYRCKEVGARLYRLGKNFNFKIKKESLKGTIFDLIIFSDRRKKLNNLKLSLLGRYQVENASLAIESVLQLQKFGFKISDDNIKKALKTAFFPGRFEIINYTLDAKRYTLILDGAHNPTKMKAFLTSLEKLYPKARKIFIVGFKFDKDIPKMLQQILKVADTLVITQFKAKTDVSTNASINTQIILEDIKKLRYYDIKKIIIESDSRKALDRALNILISQYPNINAIVVVTGSLYLVGEIRSML